MGEIEELASTDQVALIEQILPEITKLRHDLHRYPELGYEEKRTSDRVATFLQASGIELTRGVAETGVVGFIRHKSATRTVAFRADMDALPITETSDVPYKSKNEGVAHSCGHDGHTAILLGSARILSELRDEFQSNIKFIFQPAEEGGGGGKKMVREGVLKSPDVDAIFALHSWPDLSCGQIGYRYGAMFANTDSFKVIVRGRGGHGAYPHRAIDPIVMAATIVEGFQTIVSRVVGPLNPTVLTVAHIEGGTTHNVIPGTVTMEGTIRTLDRKVRDTVIVSMNRVINSAAEMYGAPAPTLEIIEGYPSLVNDKAAVNYVVTKGRGALGQDNVMPLEEPTMGGEDFAYYLSEIPGAMYRLGVKSATGPQSFLHTASFNFNDDAIRAGMTITTRLAMDFENDWGRFRSV